MKEGDRVWFRFTTNCGDLIFENGESPEFKAGQIVVGNLWYYTGERRFGVRIDWGCGQSTGIHAALSKIELVPEMEVIALATAGLLELDE